MMLSYSENQPKMITFVLKLKPSSLSTRDHVLNFLHLLSIIISILTIVNWAVHSNSHTDGHSCNDEGKDDSNDIEVGSHHSLISSLPDIPHLHRHLTL